MLEREDEPSRRITKPHSEDAWCVPPAFEGRIAQTDVKTMRERLHGLLALFNTSARQIRGHYPQLGNIHSWYHNVYQAYRYGDVDTFSPNVWLTAHPEQVFGEKTAYHVTSTAVLPDLLNGVGLLAPRTHAERKVVTHRGIGLAWMGAFIKILGFSTWDKDFAVWMSGFVDNEQCTVEHAIAQLTPYELSLRLARLFFGKGITDLQECVRARQFDPQLHALLLNALGAREPLSPEQESYLQSFMWRFFELTGTREGWWESIKTFLGCTDPRQRFSAGEQAEAKNMVNHVRDRFQQSLYDILEPLTQNGSKQESPNAGVAVLQIDTQQMFDEVAAHGPYPLFPGDPTGMRDHLQIMSTPYVQPSWVQGVWLANINDMSPVLLGTLQEQGIEVNDINSIPSGVLMDENTPALLSSMETLQPGTPLCARRYSRPVTQRQADWLSLLQQGLVAPLKTLDPAIPAHLDVLMHMIGAPSILYSGATKEKETVLATMLTYSISGYRVAGVFE